MPANIKQKPPASLEQLIGNGADAFDGKVSKFKDRSPIDSLRNTYARFTEAMKENQNPVEILKIYDELHNNLEAYNNSIDKLGGFEEVFKISKIDHQLKEKFEFAVRTILANTRRDPQNNQDIRTYLCKSQGSPSYKKYMGLFNR